MSAADRMPESENLWEILDRIDNNRQNRERFASFRSRNKAIVEAVVKSRKLEIEQIPETFKPVNQKRPPFEVLDNLFNELEMPPSLVAQEYGVTIRTAESWRRMVLGPTRPRRRR